MPLGDSETLYYAPYLKNILDGHQSFKTVGSIDGNHEGHPTFRSDEIAANVTSWLTQNPAEVVFLYAGTNDILQCKPGGSAGYHIPEIISKIRWFDPSIFIVLAEIAEVRGFKEQVLILNDFIKSCSLADATVDIFSAVPMNSENFLIDGIHPTPTGCQKMASAWFYRLMSLNL